MIPFFHRHPQPRSLYIAVIFASIALLFIGIGLAKWHEHNTEDDHRTHYHAGFVVVLDGEVQEFSGLEHMYMRSCGIGELAEEDILPSDRVHLHNEVGDVAHIHDEGVIWLTLLQSLRVDALSDNWFVYRDGKLLTDGIDSLIEPYESVIISDREISNAELSSITVPTRSHIEETEQGAPENCGVTFH